LAEIKALLKEDDPAALLPYLEETLIRMSDNEDKDAKKARAFCMYQIGMCEMQLGQYSDAIDSFTEFTEAFPKDPNAPQAFMRVAEAHAIAGNWPVVEEYTRGLLSKKSFDSEQKLTVRKLLSAALFHQQKWDEAVA